MWISHYDLQILPHHVYTVAIKGGWHALEDELHKAEDGDLLAQLALVRDEGGLCIESSGVLGAQGVIGVQVAMIEGFQHLPQPRVRTPAQCLHLCTCRGRSHD